MTNGIRIAGLSEANENEITNNSLLVTQIDNNNNAFTKKLLFSSLFTALKRLYSVEQTFTRVTITSTTTLTAVNQNIFINLTSVNGITVNLPASPATGNEINLFIYGNINNRCTISFNGRNFRSNSNSGLILHPFVAFKLIYVDATVGWLALPDINIISNIINSFTLTYTGNGSTNRDILNLPFTPSLLLIKARGQAYSTTIYDTIRGAALELYSDLTNASTSQATGLLNYFDKGFKVSSYLGINQNAVNYIAYGFRCTSFTYTGNGANRTLTHNLGETPKFLLIKSTSTTGNWYVYHSENVSPAHQRQLLLNSNAASSSDTTIMTAAPDATSLFLSTSALVNSNGVTYIAYLFPNFNNAFGKYVGTATSNFINIGFTPKILLIKRIDTTGNWFITDFTRDNVNPVTTYHLLNSNAVEAASGISVNFVPDGISIDSTDTNLNALNGQYIYMAWC